MKSGIAVAVAANANSLDILSGLGFRTVPLVPGFRRAILSISAVYADQGFGALTDICDIEVKLNDAVVIERSPIKQFNQAGSVQVVDFPRTTQDVIDSLICAPGDTIVINLYNQSGAKNVFVQLNYGGL